MSNPPIHGKFLNEAAVLEALGNDLLKIKMADRLRWKDIGEVLGVGEDQAAKYADASAEMGVVAYSKGKAMWRGRFTGTLDQMIDQSGGQIDGQQSQTLILRAAVSLSAALEDGSLTDAEITANRRTLEDAKAAIDKLLSRVGPKGITA